MSTRTVVAKRPIGECCQLINGRAFKSSEWRDEGLPIVRIQNLNDPDREYNYFSGHVEDRHVIDSGELLFAWSGTPGTSFGAHFWERGPAVLNQHIFRVVLDEREFDKRYFYYALNHVLDLIIDQAHGGVGLKHITKTKLVRTPLPTPSIEYQRRVVSVLDRISDVRKKRRRALDLAPGLIRSAFLEMFGDPHLNPKQWDTVPLESLIDQSRGISYGIVQRGPEVPDGVPVVRISNFLHNRFTDAALVRTSSEIASRFRRTVLTGGELLLSIRGTVGRVGIVPATARGWNVSREVAVIPLLSSTSPEFVQGVLLSDSIQKRLAGQVKGVAQRGINLSDVRKVAVPEPPKALVARFSAFCRQTRDLERSLEDSAEKLAELSAALSARAFAGRL